MVLISSWNWWRYFGATVETTVQTKNTTDVSRNQIGKRNARTSLDPEHQIAN